MFRNLTLLVCGITAAQSSFAFANDSDSVTEVAEPAIVKVEEDWIVYVRNPDAELAAPQIAHVISPLKSTESVFGMVEINHRSQPRFHGGGVQVQTWLGRNFVDYAESEQVSPLRTTYDKMTYTVGMQLKSTGGLQVYLRDGRSRTWGRFAHQPIIADAPGNEIDLTAYDPQFSVDNTAINHGAHRVELMYMRKARYYSAQGLERTDNTPRIIHRFQSLVQFVSLEEYEQKLSDFNIEITEQ